MWLALRVEAGVVAWLELGEPTGLRLGLRLMEAVAELLRLDVNESVTSGDEASEAQVLGLGDSASLGLSAADELGGWL